VTSVFNDIELRELSTSPSGATSHALFAASSYLDIPASRALDIRALRPRFPVRPTSAASAAQTTFAASCCLTLGGSSHPHPHPHLQFNAASTDLCSFAARTTPAAARCATSWALWCPVISTHGPQNGSLPFLQLASCMTDLCSRVLPREPLFLCSLGCRPEHDRASTICLTG
jgi:hypothetical protein